MISENDIIFELHCVKGNFYLNSCLVKKISKKGRIICDFGLFTGLKQSALNQFTRQYRCWDERGNHLNMFRCYTDYKNLEKNIFLFKKRFKKITGIDLPQLIIN